MNKKRASPPPTSGEIRRFIYQHGVALLLPHRNQVVAAGLPGHVADLGVPHRRAHVVLHGLAALLILD